MACNVRYGLRERDNIIIMQDELISIEVINYNESTLERLGTINWNSVVSLGYSFQTPVYTGPKIVSNSIENAALSGPAEMLDSLNLFSLKSLDISLLSIEQYPLDYFNHFKQFLLRHPHIEELTLSCPNEEFAEKIVDYEENLKRLNLIIEEGISSSELETIINKLVLERNITDLVLEFHLEDNFPIKLNTLDSRLSNLGLHNLNPSSEVNIEQLTVGEDFTVLSLGGTVALNDFSFPTESKLGLFLFDMECFDFEGFKSNGNLALLMVSELPLMNTLSDNLIKSDYYLILTPRYKTGSNTLPSFYRGHPCEFIELKQYNFQKGVEKINFFFKSLGKE